MIDLTQTPQAGRYAVLYVDPPWRYLMHSDLGREKAPDAHYECMDLDAIKALPVDQVAGQHCYLFLWTTWPFLVTGQAHELVEAWSDPDNPWKGVTGGSWHKKTKNGLDAFGQGYIFRTSSEPLMLFERGDPRWHSRSERNSWHEDPEPIDLAVDDQIREHSRKPDSVRHMIERATRGPRLEMFARSGAEGWDAWGDQAGLFDNADRVAALKAAKAERRARQPSLF